MLQRYLLVWLTMSSGLAYFWPVLVPGGSDLDPFVASMSYVNWLIVATMFCIGSMLPTKELEAMARRWRAVIVGVLTQYTTMPLFAWLFASLFGLQGDAFLGVVMVGCVPGAMASNVLTWNARGNTSFSVSLTTVATLVSPLAVPLAILMALQVWKYDEMLLRSSLFMTATVVIPVALGYAVSRVLGHSLRWQRIANVVANLSILIIIAGVVGKNREPLRQLDGLLLLSLLCINVAGYVAGYCVATFSRFDDAMRRAVTLEIGMQNAGLGVALAAHLFPHRDQIAVAPAIYTFGCMLTGTALAQIWSRIPPKPEYDARRCEGTSWQPPVGDPDTSRGESGADQHVGDSP